MGKKWSWDGVEIVISRLKILHHIKRIFLGFIIALKAHEPLNSNESQGCCTMQNAISFIHWIFEKTGLWFGFLKNLVFSSQTSDRCCCIITSFFMIANSWYCIRKSWRAKLPFCIWPNLCYCRIGLFRTRSTPSTDTCALKRSAA